MKRPGLTLFALFLFVLGSCWYSQSFPASSTVGWIVALLVFLLLVFIVLAFRRASHSIHWQAQRRSDQPLRCGECWQESGFLEWCIYMKGTGRRHTWLCRDCQNLYHATVKGTR